MKHTQKAIFTLTLLAILSMTLCLYASGKYGLNKTTSFSLEDHKMAAFTTTNGKGNPAKLSSPGSSKWQESVRLDLRAREYNITWQKQTLLPDVKAAWHAPNRAHNLRIYFTEKGIRVLPRKEEKQSHGIGLTLSRFGYEGDLQSVADAKLVPEGNRMEYRRGTLTEWYINDPEGLEQGITINAPPKKAEGAQSTWLELAFTLSKNTVSRLSQDGRKITLGSKSQTRMLQYSDLKAFDANRKQLPSRIALVGDSLRLKVNAQGARYPVIVDPVLAEMVWMVQGNNNLLGHIVSSVGDVNGDGYDDVIIGAQPFGDTEYTIYLGSASGPEFIPHWSTAGLGLSNVSSVSAAGDVNNDNYDDVFVIHGAMIGVLPTFSVYLGSASGLGDTEAAAWSFQFIQYSPNTVAAAGDVNGDNYVDYIMGVPDYNNNNGAAFVHYGSATGLSATPDWSFEGGASDKFGSSVSTAGDVNGDGYDDVIIGAPSYDNDQSGEGAAYIFLGSATGLATSSSATLEGNEWDVFAGSSVASAGDVNNDGYDDVLVGAAGENTTLCVDYGGRVQLYLGENSAEGVNPTPVWSDVGGTEGALFGGSYNYNSIASAGDINNDGFDDVIIGAPGFGDPNSDRGAVYVYLGTDAGTGLSIGPAWYKIGQDDSRLGWSVFSAGDTNADGYDDIIVGANSYNNNDGAAFVYLGSAGGLPGDWKVENLGGPGFPTSPYGVSVATANVNNDLYDDLIVGVPYYDGGQNDEGAVFVYHGSSSGPSTTPDWSAESNEAGAYFGQSVASAKVNGDNYDDVIVGAPFFGLTPNSGGVFVYHGSATGLPGPASPPATPADADWSATGASNGDEFGFSVASAGDFITDGFEDIIVGAPHAGAGGTVYVFKGSFNGLTTPASADWSVNSAVSGASFGWSVASAGDVNLDQADDVIVGSPYYDGGQNDEGAAYVYYGSADVSGPDTTADWMMESDAVNTKFGYSVSSAGDVNNDYYSDIIVGAPGDSGSCSNGSAFVYHGSQTGLSATYDWTASTDRYNAMFGYSVATAGDVNADFYSDVIIGASDYQRWFSGLTSRAGAAFIYLGSASGLSAEPKWMADGQSSLSKFGGSVSAAGDVNGDGRDDVIVGEYSFGSAYVYTRLINRAPTASNGTLGTDEDTPASDTLSASDGDGDALVYNLSDPPTKGSVTLDDPQAGDYTYTPQADANGSDSFTFLVHDGTEPSNTATIDVTITAVNDPPVASDTTQSTDEDQDLNGTLPASDVDNDPLVYGLVTNASSGTTTIDTDTGAFTYTPDPDFFGIDSFTFRVFDGKVYSNPATYTVNVVSVNDPPVVQNISVTTDEDVPVSGIISFSDIENDAVTFSIFTPAAKGFATFTDPAAGVFEYTPNANESGSDTFTYRAWDGDFSNTGTATVTINELPNGGGDGGGCFISTAAR